MRQLFPSAALEDGVNCIVSRGEGGLACRINTLYANAEHLAMIELERCLPENDDPGT